MTHPKQTERRAEVFSDVRSVSVTNLEIVKYHSEFERDVILSIHVKHFSSNNLALTESATTIQEVSNSSSVRQVFHNANGGKYEQCNDNNKDKYTEEHYEKTNGRWHACVLCWCLP